MYSIGVGTCIVCARAVLIKQLVRNCKVHAGVQFATLCVHAGVDFATSCFHAGVDFATSCFHAGVDFATLMV